MRGYFETSFRFNGTQNELRILLTQLLGFPPFFVQSNFDGTFQVNFEIAKLMPAPVQIPIADLYAEFIAAVNRGDLPGAQTIAARIAA